jgi:hypothetical protein
MSTRHEKGLTDLEKLLAALPPRPTTLDRDHLLFRAGQASMSRSWMWPFAAVVMSVACGCLAIILVLRPLPEPVVRVVHVPIPAPAPPLDRVTDSVATPGPATSSNYAEGSSPTMSYWALQQQALRFGAEGLPEAAARDDETPGMSSIQNSDFSAGIRPRLNIPTSYLPFGGF